MLDVEKMEFRTGPEMQTKRSGCVATQILDDDDAERVLVIGGYGDDAEYLSTTEILCVANEEERSRLRNI